MERKEDIPLIMNKMTKAVLPILLTSVLLVTGCLAGSEPSSRTSPIAPVEDIQVDNLTPSSRTSPIAPVEGIQVDNLAPEFRLSNLEGQSISLSDFRGSPVLINFWATWCPPCREEMPFLQQIYEEWLDKKLVLLAVDIGETPDTVESFMQSQNLSFPVLLDTNKDVAPDYNIRYIPTTFLIDEDGIIQVVKVGAFSSTAEIERNLSKIIP